MPTNPAKAYNGGAVTATAGNNSVAIHIAASAPGSAQNGNGVYRISRATVNGGIVGAYAVVGQVPAQYDGGIPPNGAYDPANYIDNNVVNGTTYSYTVALDNNA